MILIGRTLTLVILILFTVLWQPTVYANDAPVIAAASDLTYALNKVSSQFSNETGHKIRISFGSSGNLKRQIEQGAPFELFMSADENYVLHLAEKGYTQDKGLIYASGRLALFAPHGSPLAEHLEMSNLADLVAGKKVRKFAIANPNHAPYGRAAREALENLNLWKDIEGTMVFGESASQATLFAASGATQGAIIPHALALNPAISKKGNFRLIEQDLHAPLRQRMVLLKDAGETAQQFYAYLQSAPAREILREYGFTVSGEM